MSKIKIDSSNIEEIEFWEDFKEVPKGLGGAMVVTFKRTGAMYAYYPMLKSVYDYHAKVMKDNNASSGSHFKNNIQNLYESKKL